MSFDSMIFDLDGTLWDSSQQIADAWSQTLKETFPEVKRIITRADIQSIMGMVTEQIAETLFGGEFSKQKALEITNTVCAEECKYLIRKGGNLYEGVEKTLKQMAKEYPLFIVSNCQCGYIESFLEYHQLGHLFQGFLCSGETGMKKGENILLLMKQYGLKHPIYIGDTYMDYEASLKAEIPFLYVAYGFGKVPDGLPQIKRAEDLPTAIREFQKNER